MYTNIFTVSSNLSLRNEIVASFLQYFKIILRFVYIKKYCYKLFVKYYYAFQQSLLTVLIISILTETIVDAISIICNDCKKKKTNRISQILLMVLFYTCVYRRLDMQLC